MNTSESSNYQFSSPYPKPQYDYPTSHSKSKISMALGSRSSKDGSRPPSPTPSELEEINEPFIPKSLRSAEFYKKPKVILWILVGVLLGALTILLTIYHKQIENALRPAANWIQKLKFGWLIPIAILFVISFPPLFGHEVVAVLCGNVYGLWIGFGIVAAGTVLGEVGNFYAFKYLCKARAKKLETDTWFYACLARTVREGGFLVVVMARLSVIPGHFTTAVFATCGMNIFIFIIAAILSMPKQFVTVYLGVLLEESATPGSTTSKSRIVSDVVVALSVLITSGAMWYIIRKMKEQRIHVVRERRMKMRLGGNRVWGTGEDGDGRMPLTRGGMNDSATSLAEQDVFNPRPSEVDLHAGAAQKWDRRGKARQDTAFEPPAVYYDPHPQGKGKQAEQRYASPEPPNEYYDPYDYNSYPPAAAPPPAQSVPRQARSPQPVVAHPYAANYDPQEETQVPARSPAQIPSPLGASGLPPPALGGGFPSPQKQPQTIPPPPSGRSPALVDTRDLPASKPEREQTQQPRSPFEDTQAVKIPAHVPRFQLSDSGFLPKEQGHKVEATDDTFYTASSHSRGGTEDDEMR